MRALLALFLGVTTQLLAQDPKIDIERINREVSVELSFREPSPQFARLSLKPVGTAEIAGRKAVSYSISVTGLNQNQSYILMTWDIGTDAPVIALQHVRVDDTGLLRCVNAKECPGSEVGAELVPRVTGMLGQPRRFVLTGKDKKPVAMGEAVPFPAIGKDGDCTVEAVILRPNASVTLVIGQGFVPGEVVKFASSSRGENVGGTTQADATGRVLRGVLPFVKGYEDGQTSVTLQGSKCHPNTAFNWGSYREEVVDALPTR